MRFNKITVIVLDGVGIGAQPDAEQYGDRGAHTSGEITNRSSNFNLPHLQNLGLGNIAELKGIPPVRNPLGYYGKMQEVSVGKDTMTGHWELMGLKVDTAFPTYPDGFPDALINQFE